MTSPGDYEMIVKKMVALHWKKGDPRSRWTLVILSARLSERGRRG